MTEKTGDLKSGFILYFDNYPALASLTMEQRGLLLTALFTYGDRLRRGTEDTLEEVLDQFPQLSNEAVMACRFMGAAILRDTQRWLSQRDYWDQRKQAQPAPSYARKKVPGMVPDPGREVRQESPEEYHRKLEKLAQMARQA